MISDLTERKQAERERERLHAELADAERLRAVGQLVSGVAHELNNPLASILGFAELLLQDSRSPEDEEGLRIIQEQGLRARSIVRDLLQFVRRSETRTIERVELPALLERVARLQRLQVDGLGVRLETAAEEGLHACDVDVVGMEQVLANLVLNGAQAAGKGGVVRVHARRGAASGTCELVVEDDGPGIAANVMPRIFEPFFTTKPHGQGTGLGLSVSLGIVEQHGGTIRAENRTDGRGARFVVSLPASEEIAPAPREPEEAEPRAAAERGAMSFPEEEPALVGLIVEDEPTIRAAMRRYFERRGWVLHEAKDGFGALTYLLGAEANQRIDVVICDLKMPGMSGIDLHELLAATRPALLDRLLFSTGDTASPEAAAFLATTRCPVIEKPFELDVLGEMIERLRAAGAR
jgi:CheY-like chemotaxis protein/two-component sensor histidine kinase